MLSADSTQLVNAHLLDERHNVNARWARWHFSGFHRVHRFIVFFVSSRRLVPLTN
jgi:hypothetical protein